MKRDVRDPCTVVNYDEIRAMCVVVCDPIVTCFKYEQGLTRGCMYVSSSHYPWATECSLDNSGKCGPNWILLRLCLVTAISEVLRHIPPIHIPPRTLQYQRCSGIFLPGRCNIKGAQAHPSQDVAISEVFRHIPPRTLQYQRYSGISLPGRGTCGNFNKLCYYAYWKCNIKFGYWKK